MKMKTRLMLATIAFVLLVGIFIPKLLPESIIFSFSFAFYYLLASLIIYFVESTYLGKHEFLQKNRPIIVRGMMIIIIICLTVNDIITSQLSLSVILMHSLGSISGVILTFQRNDPLS